MKRIAERYKKLKLLQLKSRLQERIENLSIIDDSCSNLQKIAQESNVYPLDESINQAKKTISLLDNTVETIASRTMNTEWESVPHIGPSFSRLKYVQTEIMHYLSKYHSIDAEVSAWDVAHEMKDAFDIASIAELESIKL